MPAFLVETAAPSPFDYTDSPPAEDELDETPQRSYQKRQTKLSQYLAQLAQRPSNVPNIDEGVGESVPLDGTLGQSGTTAGSQADGLASMGLSRSGSSTSFNGTGGISASSSVNSGLGIVASSSSGNLDGADGGASAVPGQAPGTSRVNPEQDSFSYIEAILESLAYLGKLGLAMDTVLQRAPLEMYNLVEATVVDVDERYDYCVNYRMRDEANVACSVGTTRCDATRCAWRALAARPSCSSAGRSPLPTRLHTRSCSARA